MIAIPFKDNKYHDIIKIADNESASTYENGEKVKMYFFTRYGMKTPHELKLNEENTRYYFIIGKESTGIPKLILREHLDDCIRLPINDKIRSLNVSNVAAVVIFETLRQKHSIK